MPRSAKTPLFRALQRAMHIAARTSNPSGPPADEVMDSIKESRHVTRRDVLKLSLAASGLVLANALPIPSMSARKKTAPRIVIVGAGLAGLAASHRLRKAGMHSRIFEASGRSGGRVITGKNILGQGLRTELGGEFIDTKHLEMFALRDDFHLKLIDLRSQDPKLREHAYFIGGRHYSEREVIEAFQSILPAIIKDKSVLPDTVTAAMQLPPSVQVLDETSLAEYISTLAAPTWLQSLLIAAYTTEYGLDASEQSAINFLSIIPSAIPDDHFPIFGESDERYRFEGGNQTLIDALHREAGGSIENDRTLESIRMKGKKIELNFSTRVGSADVLADFVILALPFTMLREVKIDIPLPTLKKKAIAELGYGTNAKILAGFSSRPWEKAGFEGYTFTDQSFQTGWDNSRTQQSVSAGYTFFLAGKEGRFSNSGQPIDHATKYLPELDQAFAGSAQAFNGNAERFHWPSAPFVKGSYACYTPGQYTSIAGEEIKPVGNLFFAGEHCSTNFQGFMNGAAETGRVAAENILSILGK
jgi:monoamine oxidase